MFKKHYLYTGWPEIGWCQLASCHANLVIAVKIISMGASWIKNCLTRPMILVWKFEKFIFHYPFIFRSFLTWSVWFSIIGLFFFGKTSSFEWAQKQRNQTTAWCDTRRSMHEIISSFWPIMRFSIGYNLSVLSLTMFKLWEMARKVNSVHLVN